MMKLRGESRCWKLLLTDGAWRLEAVPFDQPGGVVGFAELEQRAAQVLDAVEAVHPEEVLLQGADEALAQPLPSGARTKAGELVMPGKRSSFWKSSAMYWLP